MKFTIIAMTVILSALNAYAQNSNTIQPDRAIRLQPDSIRLEFPDQHGLIVFQLAKFLKSNTEQIKADQTIITGILASIEKSLPSTAKPMKADVVITESRERRITIHEHETLTTRITTNEKETTELLPPGWEITIHIPANGQIYLYAQTFSELKAMVAFDADAVRKMIVDESGKIYVGRKRIVSRIIFQNGAVAFHSTKFQMPADQLEFSGMAGFGFVSRSFVPSLGITASFRFGDRFNVIKNQYTLFYENLFFTNRTADGKYTNRSNSFISVAYGRKIGGAKSYTWVTLGAGILIYRTGDYFQGKTAKFFFSTSAGKFAVTPELYLTNDFKNFQTGLKLVYRF